MARLKEDPYWGSNRNASTDAQIKNVPRARTIDEIIAASRTGNAPTVAEVQRALKQLQEETKRTREQGQKATPTQQAQLNALLYEVPKNAAKPSFYNDPSMAFASKPKPAAYNGPSLGASGMGAAGKAVSGMFDSVKGIGGAVADMFNKAEAEAANTPEAILRRLQEQAGGIDYNGPSAEEMAKRQFDPQFALLDQLAKQTEGRYKSNKQDISQMYAGLVNDQTAGRAQDQKMFAGAVDSTGKNYAAASDNVSKGASAYSQAMAEQLARLGVKEGMGDIAGGVQNNLQDNLTRLNRQGTGTQDLLTSLGANEYAYDTNQIGTAKQAGINTQEQFLQDFMDRMAGNDQQRLQLTGQQAQASNDYSMQIQKMLQDAQAAQQGNITDQLQAILSGNQAQSADFYKQAQLDLQQQQFAYQQQQDAYKNSSNPAANLNPYDALSQRAATQYKDPVKARQAVDEILAAYQNNPNATSVGDFLNGVDQETLRNNPEMTSLIYDFISRIIGQQKR